MQPQQELQPLITTNPAAIEEHVELSPRHIQVAAVLLFFRLPATI